MDPNWLNSLPKIDKGTYEKIAMNDLLVFSVFVLSEQNRDINYEDIVAASFTMFPDRFALRGYPAWPDSAVTNKRWLDCRDKALILGSTKDGFSITAKGIALAERTRLALDSKTGGNRIGSRVLAEQRTRAGRFVRALETSDAFKRISSSGDISNVSEFEFRSMLLCTMESSPETLSRNIEQFKQFAAAYDRDDLIKFLRQLEDRFSKLLEPGSVKVGVVRGGMVPKHSK